MKQVNFAKWMKDTEVANDGKVISVGNQVVDPEGNRGIVVKIIRGSDEKEHGTIVVWQLDRLEYGADNCEHYPYENWNRILRIQR